MKRQSLMSTLALASSLVVGAAACKSNDSREVEKAAERVESKSADLAEESKELGKEVKEGAKEIAEEAGDVMKKSAEVDTAAADFERKKTIRIANLEGQLAILSTMPQLVNAMASGHILKATERTKLDEKLQVLQVRIEEAKAAMTQLPATTAADWTARDDEMTKMMKRIDEARDEAIDIVDDAEPAS